MSYRDLTTWRSTRIIAQQWMPCNVPYSQLNSVTHELEGAWIPGPWFNIKMSSYQYRKSHCGDKTVVRSSYLHNGISYTGKMSSLYWIRALCLFLFSSLCSRHSVGRINSHEMVNSCVSFDDYQLIVPWDLDTILTHWPLEDLNAIHFQVKFSD